MASEPVKCIVRQALQIFDRAQRGDDGLKAIVPVKGFDLWIHILHRWDCSVVVLRSPAELRVGRSFCILSIEFDFTAYDLYHYRRPFCVQHALAYYLLAFGSPRFALTRLCVVAVVHVGLKHEIITMRHQQRNQLPSSKSQMDADSLLCRPREVRRTVT